MEKKMIEIGKILQQYFGCKNPINKKGQLTESGKSTFREMIRTLTFIGWITGHEDVTDRINRELCKIHYANYYQDSSCCLETIFIYFGSRRPFKNNGELSKNGLIAYAKMVFFIHEICGIYNAIKSRKYKKANTADILRILGRAIADRSTPQN